MVDLVCVAFSDRRYLMGLPRPYGVVFLKGQKYPKALLQHADLRFATGFYASHSLLRLNPRVGLPWPPRSRGGRSTGPTTFSRSPLRFSPGTALGNSPSCGWLKHPSLASAPGCNARQRTKSRPRHPSFGGRIQIAVAAEAAMTRPQNSTVATSRDLAQARSAGKSGIRARVSERPKATSSGPAGFFEHRSAPDQREGGAPEQMVLGTFAKTKVPRQAGTKRRINKNPVARGDTTTITTPEPIVGVHHRSPQPTREK